MKKFYIRGWEVNGCFNDLVTDSPCSRNILNLSTLHFWSREIRTYRGPSSRPKPLRLFPPHGAWQKHGCEQLIHTIPALRACREAKRKIYSWHFQNYMISNTCCLHDYSGMGDYSWYKYNKISPLTHVHTSPDHLKLQHLLSHTCER